MDAKVPNIKLRNARLSRNWKQQDVADRIGTTELSIGRWERGETFPSAYFRQQLCDLFEMRLEELGLIEELYRACRAVPEETPYYLSDSEPVAASEMTAHDEPDAGGGTLLDSRTPVDSETTADDEPLANGATLPDDETTANDEPPANGATLPDDETMVDDEPLANGATLSDDETTVDDVAPPRQPKEKGKRSVLVGVVLALVVVGGIIASIRYFVTPPVIKPGGGWISPLGKTVKSSIYFAAYAYPTHDGEPEIDHVNFTLYWQGADPRKWVIACVARKPLKKDTYSCTADLRVLGVPPGQITVSFDVYDRQGNHNNAPNGPHTVTYAP